MTAAPVVLTVRERAIEVIYQAFGGDVHRVNLSGVIDALETAGLQLIDTRTHWAAPNETTEQIISAYWWAVENEPHAIVGDLPAVAKHRYSAIRDAAK